jgi:hypothetical protein
MVRCDQPVMGVCPIRGAQIPSFRRKPESRHFNPAGLDPGFRRGDGQGGQTISHRTLGKDYRMPCGPRDP